MAVVTNYSSAFQRSDEARRTLKNAGQIGGQPVHRATGTVAIANGDSIGSKLYLANVPSNAILSPLSAIYNAAITSLNDVDLGDAETADALVNGADFTSAGSVSAMDAVALADYGKPLWELLGHTEDPGGMIDLFLTLKAAAGAAGDVSFDLMWTAAG